MNEKPNKQKMVVSIWEPLYEQLNRRIDSALVQRDAFLDRVFAHESEMLDVEIPVPNSEEHRKILAKHLRALQRHPVTLNLSDATVNAINDVCERKRIPRDSFINRVLLFLVVPQPKFFEAILPFDIGYYWIDVIEAYMWSPPVTPHSLGGPLTVLSDVLSLNPFWAIRECIDRAKEGERDINPSIESLHSVIIPEDVFIRMGDSMSQEQVMKGGNAPNALGLNCRVGVDWDMLPDLWHEGLEEIVKQLPAAAPRKGLNAKKKANRFESLRERKKS
jgi:hypothetical protein